MMKASRKEWRNSNKCKGFTLVELLVVIAILAVLASVALPISMRVMNEARATKAKSHIKVMTTGIDSYYADYGNLSFSSSWFFLDGRDRSYSTCRQSNPVDPHYAWGAGGADQMIRALMGLHTDHRTWGRAFNPKGKKFIDLPEVDDSVAGGLTYARFGEPHGLVDPWGQPYFIVLDKDFDGSFSNVAAFVGAQGYRNTMKPRGSKTAMFCGGPYQNVFTPKDDVASWR